MTPDFAIRTGDLLPILYFQCLYPPGTYDSTSWPNGKPVDLSGATTVKFVMWKIAGTAVKISTATGVTVTDPLNGKGTYAWSGTDTDTVGDYTAYIEVTMASGKKITCPNFGFARIQVTDIKE